MTEAEMHEELKGMDNRNKIVEDFRRTRQEHLEATLALDAQQELEKSRGALERLLLVTIAALKDVAIEAMKR